MTALEIVLISVLGAFLIVITLYLFILKTKTNDRKKTFRVINEVARANSITFVGDSLTDFFPIQDFFPEYVIYNRGIAGDCTRDVLKRLDNIIELQPRRIFIQIGTNDLGKNVKPQKIVDNIKKIIETLEANIAGVEIVVISLYPVSHHKMWLSPFLAGLRTKNKIMEVNRLLIELTKAKGLKYIDLHSQLVGNKMRINHDYTIEGLHISGVGYGVIAKALAPYID